MTSWWKDIIRVQRRAGYACWYFRLGGLLRIHWHVGHHRYSKPSDPKLRLRAVLIFGRVLPLRYHVD